MMIPARPAIEEISGYLGVGSLQLLGAFFMVDGISGFYVLLETYAKTSSWAILFTVPLLVISYVLGLFSCLGAEVLLGRRLRPLLTPELFAEVVLSDNETLVQRHAEVERHSRLLYGCTIAFVLLGIGSMAEARNMGAFGFVGYVSMGAGVILAVLCPLLARHLQRDLTLVVRAVRQSGEHSRA